MHDCVWLCIRPPKNASHKLQHENLTVKSPPVLGSEQELCVVTTAEAGANLGERRTVRKIHCPWNTVSAAAFPGNTQYITRPHWRGSNSTKNCRLIRMSGKYRGHFHNILRKCPLAHTERSIKTLLQTSTQYLYLKLRHLSTKIFIDGRLQKSSPKKRLMG